MTMMTITTLMTTTTMRTMKTISTRMTIVFLRKLEVVHKQVGGHMRKLEVVQHIYTYNTAVKIGIYGLAFIMGKWF